MAEIGSVARDIGQLIRVARLDKGISQLCLAYELGLTSGQIISEIERGVKRPPRSCLKHLCEVLGLNAEVILDKMLSIERIKLYRGME